MSIARSSLNDAHPNQSYCAKSYGWVMAAIRFEHCSSSSLIASVDPFIQVYDRVLSPDLCREIVNRFEQDNTPFSGGIAALYGGNQLAKSIKATTEVMVSNREEWIDVEQHLQRSLHAYLEIYQQTCPSFREIYAPDLAHEGFRIKRYDLGGSFNWHIDSGAVSTCSRVLAMQWYFNDVTQGGETEFKYQAVSVQPKAGRLLLFPPTWTYEHQGAPVVSNAKYICTTFLRHHLPASGASL